MIIGVLGKGGSGKSTVSTNLALYLSSQKNNIVLAIDADHNMDFTFNLGVMEEFPYLGSSMEDLKKKVGLLSHENYRMALNQNEQGVFTLSPKDEFTQKYSKSISVQLSLMTAGPQTEDVLSDKSCSHILFTALKVYLPLLALQDNEWVIVDEKAGADGVSTGIPTGFDMALIVSEPTVHGMKTARQIAGLLDHYGVPYEFIINKMSELHKEVDIVSGLGKAPIAIIGFDQSFSAFDGSQIAKVVDHVNNMRPLLIGKRFERSKSKFDTQSK